MEPIYTNGNSWETIADSCFPTPTESHDCFSVKQRITHIKEKCFVGKKIVRKQGKEVTRWLTVTA
jgi:hypothetical protein